MARFVLKNPLAAGSWQCLFPLAWLDIDYLIWTVALLCYLLLRWLQKQRSLPTWESGGLWEWPARPLYPQALILLSHFTLFDGAYRYQVDIAELNYLLEAFDQTFWGAWVCKKSRERAIFFEQIIIRVAGQENRRDCRSRCGLGPETSTEKQIWILDRQPQRLPGICDRPGFRSISSGNQQEGGRICPLVLPFWLVRSDSESILLLASLGLNLTWAQ